MLFETQRLVVRRATAGDMDALLEIYGDPDHVRYFGSGHPQGRAEMEWFLNTYSEDNPRVVSVPGLALLKPALEVVGMGGVEYRAEDGQVPDLYFIFKKQYWGQGLATELASAALADAFERPEIDVVYATARQENTASIRVLEKCGMVYERYLPERNRLRYRTHKQFG